MIFRKWGGGGKGRLELFRSFVRFGVPIRPSERDASVTGNFEFVMIWDGKGAKDLVRITICDRKIKCIVNDIVIFRCQARQRNKKFPKIEVSKSWFERDQASFPTKVKVVHCCCRCGHIFHPTCLAKALNVVNSCPVCKQDIPTWPMKSWSSPNIVDQWNPDHDRILLCDEILITKYSCWLMKSWSWPNIVQLWQLTTTWLEIKHYDEKNQSNILSTQLLKGNTYMVT